MNEAPRPLPAAHRLAPGVYYGWIVALGCGAVSFATVGVGFYGTSIFLDALTRTKGLPVEQVAAATSFYFVLTGLSGFVVGRLVDRVGARGPIVVGAVLMALALVALGRVERSWELWPIYGLMALGFSLSTSIPNNAIITRWFVGLRARAMSISHSGVSVGGMLLVPLSAAVLEARGLPFTSALLAAIVVGVAIPVALGVLRFDPREHGLRADGGRSPPGAANPMLADHHQLRRWRVRDALRTRSFWLLAAAFGAILFCQQSVLVHQIAALHERTGDAQLGSFAISATAAGSAMARLVVGGFADRVSKRRLAMGLMLLQAVALVAFALAPNLPAAYAAAVVFGFTIGNVYMLQSLLVGELFGLASFGAVFGLVNLVSQTLGGLGPVALGALQARTGAYPPGLLVMAGVAVVAAAVVSRVRAPDTPLSEVDAQLA